MASGPKKTPVVNPPESAPEYRVVKKSFIGGRMCGPGTDKPTIRYEGVPGRHLHPLNEPAKKAKAAAAKAAKAELPKHLAAVSGLVDSKDVDTSKDGDNA
jgi:hypothetical protein